MLTTRNSSDNIMSFIHSKTRQTQKLTEVMSNFTEKKSCSNPESHFLKAIQNKSIAVRKLEFLTGGGHVMA